MNEHPEHDEIVNGRNPQTPPRSNRRAGVIGLVAVGGLAAGGAALYAANGAGAAPSTSTSSAPSSSSSTAAPSSSASGSTTCMKGTPGPGVRPGGPPLGGPGRGAGSAADGRITAVSSTSLTVRDILAKSHTYKITSATVVHAGPGRTVAVSTLAVGEHVVVRTSSSTTTAAEIDVRLAHIDGAVSAVTSTAITVTDPDGFTRTIDTDGQTKYTLNSASSSRSKITTGTFVHAEGKVDANGTALDAANVDAVTAAKTPPVGAGPRPCAPIGGHGPGGPGHHAGGPGAAKPTTSNSGTPSKPTPSATTTR